MAPSRPQPSLKRDCPPAGARSRFGSKLAFLLVFLLAAEAPDATGQFTAIADDFSTDGDLSESAPDSGVGNWTNISGGTTLGVSGGILTLPAAAGEAAQLDFASANLSSGTIYMGFDLSVSPDGSIGTNDTMQAVAGFRSGSASSGSYAFSFGVFRPSAAAGTNSALPASSTSQFDVGVMSGNFLNASTAPLTGWDSALSRGETQRIILGFDLAGDTGTLWVSPGSMSSASISLSGLSSGAQGVFFRAGGASHGTISIADLVVSTDFATAAGLTAIPEPPATATVIGLLALAGAIFFRRRKRRRPARQSPGSGPPIFPAPPA